MNIVKHLFPVNKEDSRRTMSFINKDDTIHFRYACHASISTYIVVFFSFPQLEDRLVGLVVKASALRAEDPMFESRLCWDFSGFSHTSDLKIDTPVPTLPGTWCYRVSAGTGWPIVSVL